MGSRGARRRKWLLPLLVALLVLKPLVALGQDSPPRGPRDRPSAPSADPGQPTTEPPEVVPQPLPAPPPPTVPSVAPPLFPTRPAGHPPAATFDLQPSLTLSEEYSDNFKLQPRDRQENFRTSLTPGLTLFINSPFTTGVLNYALSVSHDSSSESLSLFHLLLAQVAWQATPRLRFSASDAFTRGDEPTQADRLHLRSERRTFTSNVFAIDSDQLFGTIATREYYRLSTFFNEGGSDTSSHTIGSSVSVPFYQVNTALLGYEYLTSDTSGGSEITGHQFTGSLTRQIAALSGGIAAGYAFRSQPGSDVNQDGRTNVDFQIWNGSLFGAYVRGPWSLNGSVGVGGVRTDSGKEIGPLVTTMAGLSYAFARGTARLEGDRGFSETFTTGENFGVVKTQGVTASYTHSFTPAVAVGVSAFYRENEFTGVGGGTAGESASIWGGTLGSSLQLSRRVTVNFLYSYIERVATPRETSYTENLARVSLAVKF